MSPHNQEPPIYFVCFVQMGPEEYEKYRRVMTARYCATDHLSGLTIEERIEKVWRFESMTQDLARRHREELIAAGLVEERGDAVILQPSSVSNKVLLGYRPGAMVVPEQNE